MVIFFILFKCILNDFSVDSPGIKNDVTLVQQTFN